MEAELTVGGIRAQQGVDCDHRVDRRLQPGTVQERLVASRCQGSEGLVTFSSLPITL